MSQPELDLGIGSHLLVKITMKSSTERTSDKIGSKCCGKLCVLDYYVVVRLHIFRLECPDFSGSFGYMTLF